MKKVLVALAPGFEEIETITVVDILRRAGARVVLAGSQEEPVEGSRGVFVVPDIHLDKIDPKDFDMIVLPGGQPGTTNLQNNETVLKILQAMHKDNKQIAAICAAPLVLRDAGLLNGVNATSHPSAQGQLESARYSENRVVTDGNITTSRSPGTALEFAFKLVEILFDAEMVKKINKGVLAKI